MKKLTTVLKQYNDNFRLPSQQKKRIQHLAKSIKKKTNTEYAISTIVWELTQYNKRDKELPQIWLVTISEELFCNLFYLSGHSKATYEDVNIAELCESITEYLKNKRL